MFDSGVPVVDLISEIKTEVDIEIDVADAAYARWLSGLEQLVYGEIIREQGELKLDSTSPIELSTPTTTIPLQQLEVEPDADKIRFEDICAVYVDCNQLIQSTVASGVIFPDTFYKLGKNLVLNLSKKPKTIKIVYFMRPDPKTVLNRNVMLPVEFVDMAAAKLRGEAYKLSNEDSLAAKWLNEYNVSIENFKVWVAGKQAEFGI